MPFRRALREQVHVDALRAGVDDDEKSFCTVKLLCCVARTHQINGPFNAPPLPSPEPKDKK